MSGRVLGAVLAGGASSRFGSDKALAMLDGHTLLTRARATLERVSDEVVVIGRGEVADRPEPGLGPLGGIAGALAHALEQGFDTVLTIACDMPAVPDELIDALRRRAPAYCADAPVLGHWPVALTEALIERLAPHGSSSLFLRHPAPRSSDARAQSRLTAPGRRDGTGRKDGALSARRWAESVGALPIAAPVPLANVNTPADLAAL